MRPSALLALPLGLLMSAAALAQQNPPRAAAAPLTGVVLRVVDGDTLVVSATGQPPLTLRLRDMDAPEICQEGGEESRRMLEELALGQTVTVRVAARDRHGRSVARVATTQFDLGTRMVEEGWAWSVRGRDDRGPLLKQERMAKALGRGLHANAGQVYPWVFRQRHGACKPASAG